MRLHFFNSAVIANSKMACSRLRREALECDLNTMQSELESKCINAPHVSYFFHILFS